MRQNPAALIRLHVVAALFFAALADAAPPLADDFLSAPADSPLGYQFSSLETASANSAEELPRVSQADFISEMSDSTEAMTLYGPRAYATDLAPICQACPNYGLYAFLGYDAWRGISDGTWENNGIHTGLNFGTRLGRFSDWTGIGFQLGGSVGVYDWSGTDYRIRHMDQPETQGFVTGGFFRKANENSNWSFAIVQDWMLNNNFSVFAQNPTLGQWRGQIGYAVGAFNEFGIWGTWRGQGDSRNVPFFGSTTWRPIQQFNPYWHYKWGSGGADTWLWVGVPERDRLTGGGSLGDYIAAAQANVPLNNGVMLYTLVTYTHPSAGPGPTGAMEDSWNFTIGLSFFPGRNARTSTVAGQCWMPQLPVANNGTFLVDASHTY